MPQWLRALAQTSLFFWDDPPLSWGQATALLLSVGGLYTFARSPFAGVDTLITNQTLPLVLELIVALVVIGASRQLGAPEHWAPKLVRLLAMHLNLGMIVLATNHFWRWGERLPSLLWVAVTANGVATLLFVYYTVQRRLGQTTPIARLIVSALVVTLANIVITSSSVLPCQTADWLPCPS